MPLIDMHSHWATRRGYVARSAEELEHQENYFRSKPFYRTEEEMADDLRAAGVRTILDFGFTKTLPPAEAREVHEYGMDFERANRDVVLGHWIHGQPGVSGSLEEFRRCIEARVGFVGLAVNGSNGPPASDPSWKPFYDLCIEAGVPALIFVGTTGLGAGLPGGGGILLDSCHPRHLDEVAARFPDLTLIAGRPAWPWQSETIAILLHKPNIMYELHGWSPRYFTPELVYDLSRRLRDKAMFGADYPLFNYGRLVEDWKGLGLSDDVLEDIWSNNARRFFQKLGMDI
ncbi:MULTISPECIES: amidohydrolase family protein [Sphingobium]|uniref:amidohydrolase family protein n=1 Tax=Sphingobium TaxID=165695 RepID=UPI001C3FE2C8|nr:amidohydrolase family protein [Sphingobium sp. 15-1]